MSNKQNARAGFPLLSILTLIFVTLKLGGWGVVAGWSWFWVLSPTIIPIAIVLTILFVCGLVVLSSK